MGKRFVRRVSVAAVLAACSMAVAVEHAGSAGVGALQGMYPGVQAHLEDGRVRMVYGVPMTAGLDAQNAATTFLLQHGEAFGVGALELTPQWETAVRQGLYTVLSYTQSIAGIPVEYGNARVMVINQPVPRVVYAGGTLAAAPENLNAPRIDGVAAAAMARLDRQARGLVTWGEPELVIFQGDGDWVAPSVAYKISAGNQDPRNDKTFFVSASTGDVLHVRSDTVYADVGGSVKGWRSPGTLPDESYNPPALLDIPEVRVFITGGGNAYTNVTGVFSIVHGGSTPVTVNTGVGTASGAGGRWSNVVPTGGVALTANVNVTPPGPADLILNPTPSQASTAQVNALTHTNIAHTYVTDRAPGFTALDMAIATNTGVSGTCNAFFSPANLSINFYNAGGGCPNTAYSSVVAHEYGHFVVNRLNLSQNSFGEGYGDTMAALIYDDIVLGRGWSGNPSVGLRNSIAANIQYPCSSSCGSAIHCCGQQLPALWWRIRQNIGPSPTSAEGLDMARERHVGWSMITLGGPNSSNAIGPATVIEVLTIDDNDGNLNNGTPNRTAICNAFASGGITCPALPPVYFEYPSGRPDEVTPGQTTPLAVNIIGTTATVQPNTAQIHYRTAGGAFSSAPLTQTGPSAYTATLPGADCAELVEYYISAESTVGTTYTDPATAPAALYSASATQGVGTTTVVSLNMQSDPGWTVTNTAVTTGFWERAVPHTPASQLCPPFDADGSGMCWVTDNRSGNFDLDGGPTVLTTGAFDLAAYPLVNVSYSRWFASINGSPDSMEFQYSLDNGANWTTLESFTAGSGSWIAKTFSVASPTATTRFRWVTTDNPNNSVTEAGIDAFKIDAYECVSCYANCDGSTTEPVLNVADFSCFLSSFAAGEAYANCDGSTTAPVLNVADFSCFLSKFAAGCP